MAEDKDIVIDLIDTIHEDGAVAGSERLCELLRNAAEEIQQLRMFIVYSPFRVMDDEGKPFPETQGCG